MFAWLYMDILAYKRLTLLYQDPHVNSPHCLLYISYNFGSENLL